MCGICGYVSARSDEETRIRAMTMRLRHRGPDGEGYESPGFAQLGHRRLSVIDLSSAGGQPMWDAAGEVCIVYNGEIYNFVELRKECVARGCVFRGTSDTEVILNLFRLDGERAFARLDGMFAFCLADTRSATCWLVRDPMGVKPLYYAIRQEGVFFSSELGPMIESGAIAPDIDDEALRAYLRLDYVPSPLCLVRGVSKLEGGSLLRIEKSGQTQLRRYVTADEARSPVDDREALEELEELIRTSVRQQLVADVPVGIFLSGGVDSSIVAKVASEVSEAPVHAYSIGFDESEFDESPYFDEVAASLGVVHHRRIVKASEALDLVPRIAEITGEPIADGSLFPTFLLCRFARETVTVALSGDGADELFGGYPTYGLGRTADLLSHLPSAARNMLGGAVRSLPVDYGNLTFGYKARKFVEGLHPDPIMRHHRWMGTFSTGEAARILGRGDAGLDTRLDALLGDAARGVTVPLERLMRSDQRFYLQDQVLVKVDRASMANSLEVRPPFLSRPVVEFARGLPPHLKVRGRVSKVLLRQWLARSFPRHVAMRPKKGFGSPLGKWFRGELRGLVGDILADANVRRQGVLEPSVVTELVNDHWSGRADRRKEIFNLLTLTLWIDYLRNRSATI